MDEKKESVRGLFLIPYMEKVIGTLRANRKLPAVRTYTATKNSFVKFSEEKELPMEIMEVLQGCRMEYGIHLYAHTQSGV